jgi:hypothetical protein
VLRDKKVDRIVLCVFRALNFCEATLVRNKLERTLLPESYPIVKWEALRYLSAGKESRNREILAIMKTIAFTVAVVN